jgi:homoserine kinase type II
MEHDGRVWQIEPWMPGTADFETQPIEARLRDAMRCLAQWHLAARTFRPQAGETQWFRSVKSAPSPAVEHRLVLIDDWGARRGSQLETHLATAAKDCYGNLPRSVLTAFRTVAPSIANRLRMASRLQYPLQPCLRDVWHDHVLFTGDRVTGLIDLSACRTENVAADLARLLGSLLGDDRPRWSLALEEYQRYRPLSVEELALIEILDQSGVLLSGLTWLDRIYLQQETIAEPGRVLARLHRIEQRLSRLVDALSG